MTPHEDSCASACAETNADCSGPCDVPHRCWCADGSLTYSEWAPRHPVRAKWAIWQEERAMGFARRGTA